MPDGRDRFWESAAAEFLTTGFLMWYFWFFFKPASTFYIDAGKPSEPALFTHGTL
jgi:dolichol kinase